MQQINTNKNNISITSAYCSNANANTTNKSTHFSRMFNTTSSSSSSSSPSSPPPSSPPPSLIVKSEIEQHNVIKMQQMEAIRLIQISLDKLSSTTTVQLPKPKSSPTNNNNNNNNNTSTILVYKESNLHKNLLVSKILNKAKYFYYQSIVQTMRLSLISKLNYYSSLIQQLNERNNADETSIVDEMKHLMDQILHETYQFNMNSSADDQINLSTHVIHRNAANVMMGENNTAVSVTSPAATTSTQSVNYHHNGTSHISIYQDDLEKTTATSSPSSSSIQRHDEQLQTEKNKRIKQLNDVKISLYSLLFNSNSNSNNTSINSDCTADSQNANTIKTISDEKCENTTTQSENKHLAKKFTVNFSNNNNNSNISNSNSNSNKQLNNFKKRLLDRKKDSSNLMGNDSLNKRPRKMANNNNNNNSNNLILADDTNVLDNRFNIKNKRSTTKTNATKFKRSNVKISSGRGMKLRPNVVPIYDDDVYRPCPLV